MKRLPLIIGVAMLGSFLTSCQKTDESKDNNQQQHVDSKQMTLEESKEIFLTGAEYYGILVALRELQLFEGDPKERTKSVVTKHYGISNETYDNLVAKGRQLMWGQGVKHIGVDREVNNLLHAAIDSGGRVPDIPSIRSAISKGNQQDFNQILSEFVDLVSSGDNYKGTLATLSTRSKDFTEKETAETMMAFVDAIIALDRNKEGIAAYPATRKMITSGLNYLVQQKSEFSRSVLSQIFIAGSRDEVLVAAPSVIVLPDPKALKYFLMMARKRYTDHFYQGTIDEILSKIK